MEREQVIEIAKAAGFMLIADQLGYAGLWNAPKEGSNNA